MEQKKMFKQMIDFQKATFDNSFKAMTTFQEQAEKMMEIFLNQASWLPEEGKKAISDWINSYKKGRDDFKGAMEANFTKVESFFAGSEDKSAE